MKKFTLMLIALAIMTQLTDAQKVLRYKLKVGEKYGLKQMVVQDIEQTIQGMQQTMKQTIGADIVVTITGKEGNIYNSEVKFASMLFKTEHPMMKMSYDSNDESADKSNPMNKTFDILVGHQFQMKFDDMGHVKEVTGFENILEKIVEAFSDNPAVGEQMQKTLAGQFSNDVMKSSMSTMLIAYPEEKLHKGTTWTNKVQIKKPFVLNNTYNYKVEDLSGSMVSLSGTGNQQSKPGTEMKIAGMTQKVDIKGDVSLTAQIDTKTGWPSEVKMNQTLDGMIKMESPQLPAPMEIPMKIISESTFTKM
jgi:hypothetical protein